MAPIIASAQAAAPPSALKSCQSSQTVICTSSQLCSPGLSRSFLKGSHRIKLGKGYFDTRKRFKGKWVLKSVASAEVGEKVLSAKEQYLQSIYGPTQQPKSEDVDMFGGLKDMFKGFTNSGESGESSAASDAVTTSKEQLLQTFGIGGGNQPKSENNLFKDITDPFDSIKDNVMESAPDDGLDGEAMSTVKESLGNFFQDITDSFDSVSSSVNESLVKSGTEDGSAQEAMTDVDDSVNTFLQSFTDSVNSLGSTAKDSVVESSAQSGSAVEVVPNAQDSVNKFLVEGVKDTVEPAGSSVTDNVVNSTIEDSSGGEIMSSVKKSLEKFSNITDTVEAPDSSLSDSVVKSATEAGSSGDVLSSAKESINSIVQSTTDTIDSAGEAALSAKEKYLQSIGGGLKQSDSNDLFEGLKGGDVDVLSGVKDVQEAVTNSVNSVVKSITSAFDTAENAVKGTYETVNGSLIKLFKSATGSVDKSISGIPSNVAGIKAPKVSVDVDFTAPFRTGTAANDALKEVVIVVKDVTGKILVTAGDAVAKFYSSAKDSLPEETVTLLNDIEDKVTQLSQPLGEALNQAYAIVIQAEEAVGINTENPVIPVFLVVGGTLFISFSWFQSKYGGYAGDLEPSEALDLLRKEGNIVLVDIRPQELRETEGIPDLRRSARFKFATVEVLKADKTILGQLRNSNEINSLLTAAIIRNLKKVDGGTKIIVLDADGSQSKQIARGLRKIGTKRAYRVEGGYEAWAKQGLRSKMEFQETPLSILKEETEAFVEEVKPTLEGVIGVSVGLVAATYALLEWEKTLQLIGVIGLAATIYLRAESYESVEDVKSDLQSLQKPFKSVIQAFLFLTGQAEKGELQLATSPASSAVQGRMLQAAAKHGAATSEKEQGAEGTSNVTEEVSEEEMTSAVDDSELNQSHSATVNQQEPPQ